MYRDKTQNRAFLSSFAIRPAQGQEPVSWSVQREEDQKRVYGTFQGEPLRKNHACQLRSKNGIQGRKLGLVGGSARGRGADGETHAGVAASRQIGHLQGCQAAPNEPAVLRLGD